MLSSVGYAETHVTCVNSNMLIIVITCRVGFMYIYSHWDVPLLWKSALLHYFNLKNPLYLTNKMERKAINVLYQNKHVFPIE